MSRQTTKRGRKREPGIDDPGSDHHQKFLAGDKLAPFRCAAEFEMMGLPGSALPAWAADHFAKIAAKYFRDVREARRAKTTLPTLDEIAGLSRVKPTAWKAALKLSDAVLLMHVHDRIVSDAKAGRADGGLTICPTRNIPPNDRCIKFTDGRCTPVPVLGRRGHPTVKFQAALGRHLKVVPDPSAVTEDAIYRAFRKQLRAARLLSNGRITPSNKYM